MTIEEAVKSLAEAISPCKWFVSIGVGELDGQPTIYVYSKSKLKGFRTEHEGHPVVLEVHEEVRPASGMTLRDAAGSLLSFGE